jgi:flagellar assembly protein FliH
MAAIIRAADAWDAVEPLPLEDLSARAERQLAHARRQAEQMLAAARAEIETLRREAAEAGRCEAAEEIRRQAAERVAPAVEAICRAARQIQESKNDWLNHWETVAVRLACAIAGRIVRRELSAQPDITIGWVREALELAAGSAQVRLRLHPQDHMLLGEQVRAMTAALGELGEVEIVPDAEIERGGCRVDTRFGAIDQQIDAQLRRVEEELIGCR